MKNTAIIVAAGEGRRLRQSKPKALVCLRQKPLILYSLQRFNAHPLIDEIVLVTHPSIVRQLKVFVERCRLRKVKKIIPGGKTRAQSVRHGLDSLDDDTFLVLIHDGARPFTEGWLISKLISQAKKTGAAVAAVPVKSTIKQVSRRGFVEATLTRQVLWEAQTPQVFRRGIIEEAFKKHWSRGATDDSFLAEQLGVKVKVVMGSYKNIKITTPEDLSVARMLLSSMRP